MDPASPDRLERANWFRSHTELVWVHDGPLAAEHRDRPFDGALPAAWFIRDGHLTLTFPDETCRALPGQWIFPPARVGHAAFSPDIRLLSIRFLAHWPDSSPLFDFPRCIIVPSVNTRALEHSGTELARIARESLGDLHTGMRAGQTTFPAHLHLQQAFLTWLRDYVQVMHVLGIQPQLPHAADQRIPQALEYIDRNLPGHVSEAAIARHISMSVSQLNRLFLRHLHMTPKALISQRLLRDARQDLEFTRIPIKTIAYRLGFNSLPHFTRWFTKRTTQTPSAYRAQRTAPANKS